MKKMEEQRFLSEMSCPWSKKFKNPKSMPIDEWLNKQNVIYTCMQWNAIQLYKQNLHTCHNMDES